MDPGPARLQKQRRPNLGRAKKQLANYHNDKHNPRSFSDDGTLVSLQVLPVRVERRSVSCSAAIAIGDALAIRAGRRHELAAIIIKFDDLFAPLLPSGKLARVISLSLRRSRRFCNSCSRSLALPPRRRRPRRRRHESKPKSATVGLRCINTLAALALGAASAHSRRRLRYYCRLRGSSSRQTIIIPLLKRTYR